KFNSQMAYLQDLSDKEFSALMEKQKKQNITEVHLDGLALLKIINHCIEKEPISVTGQLFGLHDNNVLEVTNSFPALTRTDEEEEVTSDDEYNYQVKMLQHFHDTNIDDNIVGWYQTTYLESYLNETVIEGQDHYQLDFGKKCICILFDPLKTNNGVLGVKAIRLKDSFMDLLTKVYKEQHSDRIQITQELLSKMKIVASDMIEEIPVKIKNSKLVEAFLYELEEGLELEKEGNFDALTLNIGTNLERNLESLLECVDDLTTEQNKFLYYQRR